MAIGKKSGGRDFGPNNNANPKGAPRVPPELKELRKLNSQLVTKIFNQYSQMNAEELKRIYQDPGVPVFDKALVKVLMNNAANGDYKGINFILDRTAGKVKEKVEITAPKPMVVKLYGEEAALLLGTEKSREDNEEE